MIGAGNREKRREPLQSDRPPSYGRVARTRRKRLAVGGTVSDTFTLAGVPAPLSTTFVAPPQDPNLFVAMPVHEPAGRTNVASTMRVTSVAFVFRVKRAANWPLG